MKAVFGSNTVERKHWRRLVKNSGWANQNIGEEQKVVKRDKCMGISHLLGHVPGMPPRVYAYERKRRKVRSAKMESDFKSDDESSFRKEHLKSEGFVVVQLKGTK